MPTPTRIAILGGGITGLTAAYYLNQAGVDVDLFEAADEPGGNMRSRREGSYTTELGPNSLLLSPELEELIGELDLTGQIQDPPPGVGANRYILRGGQYRKLPASPPGLLASGFFSWKTKLSILRELTRPAAPPDATETVAAFFRRRFNQEVVDYAVNPFVAGIYAGDPTQLRVQEAFPKLVELEQQHGSVLRGLAKAGVGQRRRTVSLRGGLQALPDALAARLAGNVYFHQPVTALTRTAEGGFQVSTPSGAFQDRTYSQVLIALPAHVAAELLQPLFPAQAALIGAVYYPPMTAVHTAYRRADVQHALHGFGALHPQVEGTYAAGSIWSSSLYPDRCPADEVLFTTFVGGAQSPGKAHDAEAVMLPRVHEELCRLYGISAPAPQWQRRYVWERAIPQADANLAPARAAAAELATQGLQVVSNWQAGISVPDCVRYARQIAGKISAASTA
ncbi:protoporphyrinogen oxidase [Hymenobacter sp. BT18]|uniref:protoporphyrinogen oxidase n=1 Tax=Hymenobacter sp. BT18 TaxID=2835648 RepID=UPI00143E6E82|nr:protoporphyrinogen oxidase [Hymenobacter sp. BT18]QIX60589.1 protoporphyrinogen oxidase [Hymenobacter sp. BT18]